MDVRIRYGYTIEEDTNFVSEIDAMGACDEEDTESQAQVRGGAMA